jgi:kynurenine formamidase
MRVIDLTHPISEDLPVYFPWHPKTEVELTAEYGKDGCTVRRVSIGTHSGTHIDAPSHIFDGMPAIDRYDANLWYQEVQVLDFTPRAPLQAITVEEVRDRYQEAEGGVLIKTGWGRFFGLRDYYRTYPPLSSDAAEFLAGQGISVLASDTPFTLDVHKILLKRGIPLITNLKGTEQLAPGRIRLIAAPLLIQGGDGAPARVLAVVDS